MAKTTSALRVRQDLEVPLPKQGQALIVSLHEWEQIMERINQCGEGSQGYESFGWGMLGLATSAFIAALTFPWGIEWTKTSPDGLFPFNWPAAAAEVICMLATVGGLIGGILSLRYANDRRSLHRDLRESIVRDMQRLQVRLGICARSELPRINSSSSSACPPAFPPEQSE